MFLNPIFSILLLIVPVLVWFYIIKPRLGARITQIYAGLPSLGSRIWARIYAFRSFWIATGGVLLAALPDLLVAVAPLDFSEILPRPWGLWVGTGIAITLALLRAVNTKPGEDK
jgi:hypothetical protein